VRAHRVAFILVNGETNLLVLHRCNNPACCNPSHLYAGSWSDNTKQSVRENRHVDNRGERHGNSKLQPEDIKEILSLRKAGYLQHEIAKRFGISRSQVSNICRGKSWSHITGI